MRRIGLLGGAFNPPHAGHLRLAELALEHLGLDGVRFVPTAVSPHKPTVGPEGDVRLALLRQALEATGRPFVADDQELRRGGVSYTVDTLERLADEEPDVAWIWLLGTDQLAGLPAWRRVDRILDLAALGVALRPGWPMVLPPGLEARLESPWSGRSGVLVPLPGTDLAIASSDLRRALASGCSPEGLPIQVRDAIRRESLYLGSSIQELE